MYCVRIYYPNKPGSSFNWKHYLDVHLPLGLGLLSKYVGVTPIKVEIDQNISTDGKGGDAAYHCICSEYFADQKSAEAMLGFFEIEEPRRLLSEDWLNYTETDPEITISEVIEMDTTTGRAIVGRRN